MDGIPLTIAVIRSGIRQYVLAARTGLSETRVSRLVCGRSQPTADERRRLAEALGIEEAMLFEGEGEGEGDVQRLSSRPNT